MRRTFSSVKAAKLVPALPAKSGLGKKAANVAVSEKTSSSTVSHNVTVSKTMDSSNNLNLNEEEDSQSSAYGRKHPRLLSNFNPFMTCILCGGYFVDATTIVDCLDTCKLRLI